MSDLESGMSGIWNQCYPKRGIAHRHSSYRRPTHLGLDRPAVPVLDWMTRTALDGKGKLAMSSPREHILRLRDSIESDGYVIIPDVLEEGEVPRLIDATHVGLMTEAQGVLHREGEVYGARDLIGRVPEVHSLASSPRIKEIIAAILGPGAFAVRGLFFDKTATSNWNLPWHQDMTVAVKERRDVADFGPWTLKAGIHHAHAPAELLARMVTIRIQDATADPALLRCRDSRWTPPRHPPGIRSRESAGRAGVAPKGVGRPDHVRRNSQTKP